MIEKHKVKIHLHQTKPTGVPAHSQGCTHNPTWLSMHSQTHWHNPTGLPVRSKGRTYKLTELPVRSLGCTITHNTNTSAFRTLFITQNGYPHPPYTHIRLQKTCSPEPASVITEAARKCGGVVALSSPLPRRAEGFTTCKLRLSYEARSPAAPCWLVRPAHW